MILNGFNSDDYRYFKVVSDIEFSSIEHGLFDGIKKDMIIKLRADSLDSYIFNVNFSTRLQKVLYPFKARAYPKETPFSLIDYIRMQDPIKFKYTEYVKIIFERGDFMYINKWLKDKMNENVPMSFFCSDFYNASTCKEHNNNQLKKINSDEIMSFDLFQKLLNGSQINANEESKDPDTKVTVAGKEDLPIETKNDSNIYKFNNGISFVLCFNKDDQWLLSNPAIALIFLNQNFLKLCMSSIEILGEEKEKIFNEEYEDNVPETTIRYYRLKDDIKIKPKNINKLLNHNISSTFNEYGYESFYVKNRIKFNEHDDFDLDNDGMLRYFYISYNDGIRDSITEKEILKIADRLPQKEATKHYERKKLADTLYEKEQKANEYLRQHKARYEKVRRKNPNISPIEFMDSEIGRDKKYQATKLVKALKQIQASSK